MEERGSISFLESPTQYRVNRHLVSSSRSSNSNSNSSSNSSSSNSSSRLQWTGSRGSESRVGADKKMEASICVFSANLAISKAWNICVCPAMAKEQHDLQGKVDDPPRELPF